MKTLFIFKKPNLIINRKREFQSQEIKVEMKEEELQGGINNPLNRLNGIKILIFLESNKNNKSMPYA